MYLKKATISQIKSALRHFVLTGAAVWVVNPDADVKALIAGVVAAIIGPSIRAVDKNDPAFGKVADWVEKEIKNLAKKPRKKKA
jgi:Na+/H+ antiporter NhaA